MIRLDQDSRELLIGYIVFCRNEAKEEFLDINVDVDQTHEFLTSGYYEKLSDEGLLNFYLNYFAVDPEVHRMDAIVAGKIFSYAMACPE